MEELDYDNDFNHSGPVQSVRNILLKPSDKSKKFRPARRYSSSSEFVSISFRVEKIARHVVTQRPFPLPQQHSKCNINDLNGSACVEPFKTSTSRRLKLSQDSFAKISHDWDHFSHGAVNSASATRTSTSFGMDSGTVTFNMSSRTSGSFVRKKQEDGDGRSSTTTEECDSTTAEPGGSKAQIQVGDDVYYQEETGQNILGTVGMIQGRKIKIIFGDETEKWAPISRVKKMSFSFKEEEEEEEVHVSAPPKPQLPTGTARPVVCAGVPKKKSKLDLNGQIAPKENHQVTCGSCGTQKIITAKKAIDFSPYTSHQYNCRKCINKSKTSKNNGVIIPAHYLARSRPRSSDSNGAPAKGQIIDGISNGVFRAENDICLHCRNPIIEKVSLLCTMCERPCHPSCLALTPPPLPGDIFWSIICHLCGTQKQDGPLENDSQKLYSSRRSISCWSDVAYLLLSCLGCKNPNEKFFDLDENIIPFWEENVSRLHLPRQYKTAEAGDRRKYLLSALNNANLRFAKDEKKKSPLWAIKDRAYKGYTMVIKPPAVGSSRAVTAAGFPISVRASNPEATSAAMTTIAQTIATQAAANKASGVPIPKNSPHASANRSTVNLKSSGAVVPFIPGRKVGKPQDHVQVAKKTGSELNSGAQRVKTEIWPQVRYASGVKFLSDIPKSSTSHIMMGSQASLAAEAFSPSAANSIKHTQPQQQFHSPKPNVFSPSSGGAARVTGMLIPSPSTSGTDSSGRNCGSYPVRKNGSPVLNKMIRHEAVSRAKEADTKPFSLNGDGDFIRESPGFINQVAPRVVIKRKISPIKSEPRSPSPRVDSQEVTSATKKMKMSLPSSTDITSKRLPSPSKTESDVKIVPDSNVGQKKAMSPLQKLTDLMRNGNGGLTVARLTVSESGVQTVDINPTLEEAMDHDGINLGPRSTITLDKSGIGMCTPTKNAHGATTSSTGKVQNERFVQSEEITKDKSNVTTSPRAFKLASVSSPGASKTSPVIERRMTRPVRLKRTVVANAEAVKSKESSDNAKSGKKVSGKAATVEVGLPPATLVPVKNSRGRPRKPYKLLKRPIGVTATGILGHFNGSAENKIDSTSSSNTINESEYLWTNSTIKDLVQYGQGYRLECLPRAPDTKVLQEELAKSAIKYIKEELTPRPPTYWSTSSTLNHSKKPTNQRSRKDLKDLDSYYICGKSVDENGIKYQVVWRDGHGFEYSSDDEEELGVEFGDDYMYFENYDYMEYFFDRMPVSTSVVGTSKKNCDSKITATTDSGDNKDEHPGKIFLDNVEVIQVRDDVSVKSEPTESNSKNSGKRWADKVKEGTEKDPEPLFIDLTDSP